MKEDQTWNAFRWICAYLLLLLFLLLTSCTIYKLERRLKPDIRNWYNSHAVFLDTKAPKWIDEEKRTERFLFLGAPEEFQRYYIKNLFWEVRREGLKDLFLERIAYVNWKFREGPIPGYMCEQGRIVLLCGIPDHVEFIQEGYPTMEPASDLFTDPDVYQCWYYVLISQGFSRPTYVFKFDGANWRQDITQLGQQSDAAMLEDYWRKQFAPTEDGWTALASAWLDFQKKEK